MSVERSCDGCGMCCKLIGVQELEKAQQTWCRYFRREQGCGIYADRPPSCAAFACDWLIDERLGEEWKPDRSGFVLRSTNGGKTINVEVDPANPTAWKKAPYGEAFVKWAERGLEHGVQIMVWVGRRGWQVEPWGIRRP